MVDKIKPLLTVAATAVGGRNGHTAAADGSVKADLSVAKEMGGPGKPGTTTPEHLFAAGYAACFGGALDHGRTPARPRSPATSRSARANSAVSVWRSRCMWKTRASRRRSFRLW